MTGRPPEAAGVREPGRRGGPVVVVLNPTKVDDPDPLREKVGAALDGAGYGPVRWRETTADDPGYGMARQAVEEGAGLVLACGGDGTVRAVLTELAGTGVPLGLVPVGTGNLLARNLGIPFGDIDAALGVVLGGVERALDVGRLEPSGPQGRTERFAVMAGMGMDAAVMRDAPEAVKARIGWPAYVVSLARHLRGPGIRLLLELDHGRPVPVHATTVLVGNVGTLQGGLNLIPDAAPDDGLLDVAVLSARTLGDWLRIAGRVLLRRPHPDGRYTCHRARQIRLTARSAQPREVDGDLLEPGDRLVIEVEPAAVRVLVPAPEPDGDQAAAHQVKAGSSAAIASSIAAEKSVSGWVAQ